MAISTIDENVGAVKKATGRASIDGGTRVMSRPRDHSQPDPAPAKVDLAASPAGSPARISAIEVGAFMMPDRTFCVSIRPHTPHGDSNLAEYCTLMQSDPLAGNYRRATPWTCGSRLPAR